MMIQDAGGHDFECWLLYVSPWRYFSRQPGRWSLFGASKPLKPGIKAVEGGKSNVQVSRVLSWTLDVSLATLSHPNVSPLP